jgi:hypothetical protein
MIEELLVEIRHDNRTTKVRHTKGWFFRWPLLKKAVVGPKDMEGSKQPTLITYPQQGTFCFPLLEDVTMDEPILGSRKTGIGPKVVVHQWIRRSEPTPAACLHLIACEMV